jgi:uncharacterized membrane protein (GlpM family)
MKGLPIWAQFLLTGSIVTLITQLTEKYKASIGGILYSFPYTFLLTTLILMMNETEWEKHQKFSKNAIIGLVSKIIFTLFFYFSYKKYGIQKAILIGFIPWTIIAYFIYRGF